MITISFRRIRTAGALWRVRGGRPREKRAFVSRAKSTAVSFALWKSGRRHRVFEGCRGNASRWRGGNGRRHGEVRVLAGTFDHCYGDHWLENFFTALEENVDWLSLTTPARISKRTRRWGARICQRARIRNDGVGVSDSRATAISRSAERVCKRQRLPRFCAADHGGDFSANTRNRICCTRKCCA